MSDNFENQNEREDQEKRVSEKEERVGKTSKRKNQNQAERDEDSNQISEENANDREQSTSTSDDDFSLYDLDFTNVDSIQTNATFKRWKDYIKSNETAKAKLLTSHVEREPDGVLNMYNSSIFEFNDKELNADRRPSKANTLWRNKETLTAGDVLINSLATGTVHRIFDESDPLHLKTKIAHDSGLTDDGKIKIPGYVQPVCYNADLRNFIDTTYIKADTFIDYRELEVVDTVELSLNNLTTAAELVWTNLLRRHYSRNKTKIVKRIEDDRGVTIERTEYADKPSVTKFSDLLEQFFDLLQDSNFTKNVLNTLIEKELRPGSTRYGALTYTDTELMEIIEDKLSTKNYTQLSQHPEIKFIIAQILMLELGKFVKFESYATFKFVMYNRSLDSLNVSDLLEVLKAESFIRKLGKYYTILQDANALADDTDFKNDRMSKSVMADQLMRARRVLIGSLDYVHNLNATFDAIQQYIATDLFSIKNKMSLTHPELFTRTSYGRLRNCINLQLAAMSNVSIIERATTLDCPSEEFTSNCDLFSELLEKSALIRLSNISEYKERFTVKTTYHYDGGYDSILVLENYKCKPETRAFKLTSYSRNAGREHKTFNFHEYPYKPADAVLNSIGALYEDLASSDFVLDYFQGLQDLGSRLTGMYYPMKLDAAVQPEAEWFTYAHLLAASWKDGEYAVMHNADMKGFVVDQIMGHLASQVSNPTRSIGSLMQRKSYVRYIVDTRGKRIANQESSFANSFIRTLTDELVTADPLIYIWLGLFSEKNPDYVGTDKGEYTKLLPVEFSPHDKVLMANGSLLGEDLDTRWIQFLRVDKYVVRFPVQLGDYSPSLMVNNGIIYRPYVFNLLSKKTFSFIRLFNQTLDTTLASTLSDSSVEGKINVENLRASMYRQAVRLIYNKITAKIENTNTLRKFMVDYANFCFRQVAEVSRVNIEVFRDWHVRRTYNILGFKLYHTFGALFGFVDHDDMQEMILEFERYLPDILGNQDIFKMYVS